MNYPKAKLVKECASKDVVEIKKSDIISIPQSDISLPGHLGDDFITTRRGGDFDKLGLYLSRTYEWMIVTDCNGYSILLCLKKGSV